MGRLDLRGPTDLSPGAAKAATVRQRVRLQDQMDDPAGRSLS